MPYRAPLARLERVLFATAGALDIAIGITELLSTAPMEHRASAFQLLYRLWPPTFLLWPLAWVAVGVVLLGGAKRAFLARSGAFASAALFLVWAAGSGLSWWWSYGATLAATFAYVQVAVVLAICGVSVMSTENAVLLEHRLQDQVDALRERVERLDRARRERGMVLSWQGTDDEWSLLLAALWRACDQCQKQYPNHRNLCPPCREQTRDQRYLARLLAARRGLGRYYERPGVEPGVPSWRRVAR